MAPTGIGAFKIFMVVDTGRDYPHMPGIGIHDHGKIMEVMERCAAVDRPLMVHPHDQALMTHIEHQFWERGERDAIAYAKAYSAYDGVIWDSAVATLLRLQRATGVHLHLLHTQTAGVLKLVREAKANGQRVTCEINPWALFLGNDWAAIERLGSYALSYYVPDVFATDHAPHTKEEKEIGWKDGWKAHTGTPSTQHYMRFLVDAANKGKISLKRVAEITATVPAELFGYSSKGHIEPGFDADLVLYDLARDSEIREEDLLGIIGWSPYAGLKTKGVPVRTILRGRTIYLDGKVTAQAGYGKLAASAGPAPAARAAPR
jgi:dihydroorotase